MVRDNVLVIEWHLEDIYCAGEKYGRDITKPQAIDIINQLDNQYDPMHGLSWLTVGTAIETYFNNKGKLND